MKSTVKLLSMALVTVLALTLVAYADEPFYVQSQIGPNPVLPDIQQYLFPQMHLASVVGWKNGETPTAAPGLKIEALATGLQHPRSLYVLPNGDVLVVESKAPPPQPITGPKDIVMRYIEKGVDRRSTVTGWFSCPSAAVILTARPRTSSPIFLTRTGRRADGRSASPSTRLERS